MDKYPSFGKLPAKNKPDLHSNSSWLGRLLDAESRLIESNQKIQLFKQALKRYKNLHVDIESSDAADGMSEHFLR